MRLERKRVLIVGMARSGIAAAELLMHNGAVPVLSDMKKEDAFGDALQGLHDTACEFRLGEDSVKLLDEADMLVISPGVPIDAPVVKMAKEMGMPVVGELSIILDGSAAPRAVIRTTALEVAPFDRVDAEHAYSEGEGDRTLEYWRSAHERYWRRHSTSPRGFAPDRPVLCERFELIWPCPA